VSSSHLSQAISHFLNCYLGNFVKSQQKHVESQADTSASTTTLNGASSTSPTPEDKSKSKKNKKKANKKANKLIMTEDHGISLDWNTLTPKTLWTQISDESMAQYHYEIVL